MGSHPLQACDPISNLWPTNCKTFPMQQLLHVHRAEIKKKKHLKS